MAAASEMDRHAGDKPANGDLVGRRFVASGIRPGPLVARTRDRHDISTGLTRLLEARIDRRQHFAGADQASPDGGNQVVDRRLLEVRPYAIEPLVCDPVAFFMERLIEQRAAELNVLLALARAHEAAN